MIKPEKRIFFDFLASRWPEKDLGRREKEYFSRSVCAGNGFILDLGGGNGRLARFLAKRWRRRVIVVDFSREMLLGDEGNGGGKVFRVQADAHYLPFPAAGAGRIICFSAFPHFDDQEQVLKECFRVLRPGGELLVVHSRSRREINHFHACQQAPISADLLPSLERFRRWAVEMGWEALRLEDSPEGFIVHYRKKVPSSGHECPPPPSWQPEKGRIDRLRTFFKRPRAVY
jgi:ubiquinone/menaquinone biosynthesis C-methylase UbiE